MLSQDSDIKVSRLSITVLFLQGVPGEAGAPGLVGPRVSVLLTTPDGILGPASPCAACEASLQYSCLESWAPPLPPTSLLLLGLHPVSLA